MILILGASGLFGSFLTNFLINKKYDVLGFSRSSKNNLNIDLLNQKKTIEVISNYKPSIIINLVGLTSVEDCETNVNKAFLFNTYTAEVLSEAISKINNKCHLIHISTDHLYNTETLGQEDQVQIVNNYAFSKYAGEIAVKKLNSHTILRTNFVGRSLVAHRQSLSDLVFESAKNQRTLKILDDVEFSPLSMSTLSEMIELVISHKPYGIFNLGSNSGMSKANFDLLFAKNLDLPICFMQKINLKDAFFLKAPRPKNMKMNVSKFEGFFKINLPTLEEEICKIADEYRGS
jgi:dTDP-4-dehydrorhamnose reductase